MERKFSLSEFYVDIAVRSNHDGEKVINPLQGDIIYIFLPFSSLFSIQVHRLHRLHVPKTSFFWHFLWGECFRLTPPHNTNRLSFFIDVNVMEPQTKWRDCASAALVPVHMPNGTYMLFSWNYLFQTIHFVINHLVRNRTVVLAQSSEM